MITKVLMPKLSEAMETGKVIKWLKREGDAIKGGDVIAEIETDKANVEIEAFGTGVLRKIVQDAGAQVPVGELIGVIADPKEDISSVAGPAAAPSAPAASAAPPSSRPAADSVPAPSRPAAAGPAPSAQAPAAAEAPPPLPDRETYRSAPATTGVVPMTGAPAPQLAPNGQRVKASPLAKKIAGQAGVDLRLVQGSGPGGRIVRRDVEAAMAAPVAPTAAPPAPASVAPAPTRPAAPAFTIPPRPEAEHEDMALTPMRAAIARAMPLSKGPVPHFYVTTEVAMDRGWRLRQELNALDGQPKVTVTDMVVKACALALRRHPGVNASFQGQAIRVHHRAHIGIAVALDQGLITPVLRDADVKPLGRIAAEARDLAERSRAGKLRAQEISGATFSVSNLGMFDVEEFSAIINPPEGAILAVGSVREQPVVVGGQVTVGRRMKLTISCDHRVMDGAMGARFLQDVKRLLEEPLRLLV
jgi:pyruvate dehydrogenase E2 component (dihydrolipoamide acetyltransferase)